ncbi:MAG: FliA/WhiG family RNA polymerase sigma factor [Selenomonadaceae bacterium]|nr:FliA/WhiG family RNA polymerase sigma factor [Selenomonadaceae bacterium]MBR1857888.1 FliA/WhiG family RNA polymerase sigma factor [Selenomonadaceae bacterium]
MTVDVSELWNRYRLKKDMETRNQLAEHYLPLIKIVAGRLAISLPTHIDKDDLINSGFFGLIDAIERFEINRNIKFETYASVRVRGAMIDYLRSKDWIPVTMRQKIRKYEQVVCQLESELGRSATDEELASALNISLKELKTLFEQINSTTVVPLEEYLQTNNLEAIDSNPAETAEYRELKETLAKVIDRLPEKERLVVSLYYYDELTLKEISLILKLSEARISQLHTKAIFRMRGYLAKIKSSLM